MKIMIDTNVIISAALFPNGKAAKAFFKAMIPPYEPIVCDYKETSASASMICRNMTTQRSSC